MIRTDGLNLPLIFLIVATLVGGVSLQAQGLEFHGMEVPIDERSSFDVFGDLTPVFKDSLVLSFKFCKLPPSEYGYILRIKDTGQDNVAWNVSYDGNGEDVVIRLNKEGHNSLIKAEVPRSDIQALQWIDIQIGFFFKRDSAFLKIGDKMYTSASYHTPSPLRPKLFFGKSEYFIDVPSFAIRDLSIRGARMNPNIHFSFSETSGSKVHDATGLIIGKASNPFWVYRKSLEWTELSEISLKSNSGSIWNPRRKEIYAFNNEEFIVLDVLSRSTRTVSYGNPCPVKINLGSCFLDSTGRQLYVYEVYDPSYHPASTMTAVLDLDTMIWTAISNEQLSMPLNHHCSFKNPATGMQTIFGGFGNALYNGRFFSLDTCGHWSQIWDNAPGDRVSPRYFAAAGVDNGNGDIYIYGGMGNESGEQIVGRRYFYDLHRIDPETGEVTLLWNLDMKDLKIVPVSELVIHEDALFTLCYPEYVSKSFLKLYRFNKEDGQFKTFDDIMPIESDRMHTHADLYFDESIQRLIALKYEAATDGSRRANSLTVYSLAWPPMNLGDIPKTRDNRLALVLLLSAIFITIPVVSLIFLRRKKKRSAGMQVDQVNSIRERRPLFRVPEKSNAIYLFGDFYAKDRTGRDVSYLFSTQLRQIFCLIMQFNAEGGIASKRLSNLIWPDKDEDKVKNSRGVSINHLRKVLEQFDGIRLSYQDGRYFFESDERFYCDYLDYLKPDSNVLSILSRGRFLKFQQDPIFDEFKSSIEGQTVLKLQDYLKSSFQSGKYADTIEIAKLLFEIDPLDEIAFSYQIKALRKLSLNQEAIVRTSEFAAEYKRLNGVDYNG